MTDVQVTDHADLRVRKRLGLPRRAVERQAAAALEKGATHSQFSGKFRRYLDGIYLRERTANNMRVHGGHLYVFVDDILITCWPLPADFRNIKPRP
ncbi:hypothetical protein BAMBUS_05250 [Brevundimonas phage vB_BpoS-Bambus]|nr:hypothetical protein BAMBUS_05250 [Brevundimonas phage vB_BpoS-Bambus]